MVCLAKCLEDLIKFNKLNKFNKFIKFGAWRQESLLRNLAGRTLPPTPENRVLRIDLFTKTPPFQSRRMNKCSICSGIPFLVRGANLGANFGAADPARKVSPEIVKMCPEIWLEICRTNCEPNSQPSLHNFRNYKSLRKPLGRAPRRNHRIT